MKNCRTLITTIGFASGLAIVAADAQAQLWRPLDHKPDPNFIAAFDTSVSMAEVVEPASCGRRGGGCHPTNNNRLFHIKNAFTGLGAEGRDGAMYPFRDEFVFGGFIYSGAHFAKIKNAPMLPDAQNPRASYDNTRNVIAELTADYCVSTKNSPGCSERYLGTAGGGGTTTPGSTSCITPTPACTGDQAVLNEVFTNGFTGLTLPNIPPLGTSTNCSTPVDTGPPPQGSGIKTAIDPMEELLHELATAGFYTYPRYQPPNITGADIQTDICGKIDVAVTQLRNRLQTCLNAPDDFLDLSNYQCVPGLIANNICTPASPFAGTCVCDQSNPACLGSGANDACGAYVLKARQQVAMCYSHSDNRPIQPALAAQPDNLLANGCRANMIGYFTDGHPGVHQGVVNEVAANQMVYASPDGYPLNYVFAASTNPAFFGEADALARAMSAGENVHGAVPGNATAIRATMSSALNRIHQGTYAGANLTFDRYETRVAILKFEVPTRRVNTYNEDLAQYLGRPSRISWHAVDENGTIAPDPIWETDWTAKVDASPRRTISAPLTALGPDGSWASGRPKVQPIPQNTLDRNGDGVVPDNHPPVTWGYMLGGETSQPVIVEAPLDFVGGASQNAFNLFQTGGGAGAPSTRPRVIYVLSNGYLHAFHAGIRVAEPVTIGNTTINNTYDDSTAESGTELFRYRPAFINTMPDIALNEVVQQNLTVDGQITVKEVETAPGQFRTILIFSQGSSGPGYAALDITDPNAAVALWDRTLLNNRGSATSEPAIYTFPNRRSRLVVTGGVGGDRALFAYDVITGGLTTSRPLPGTADYRVAPVCIDARGEGATTHCYALAGDGTLARVTIDQGTGRFTTVDDITPQFNATGLEFWARPTVFFGKDNKVNIVYGSGDIRALDRTAGQNYVFKATDDFAGRADLDNSCAPDGNNSRSGVFALPANRAVVSPAAISKGVVSWTAFASAGNGCDPGRSFLYAIKFDTCADALGTEVIPGVGTPPAARAVERDIGTGVPTSPVVLRTSQRIATNTTAGTAGPTVGAANQVRTQGGQRKALRPLYWRLIKGIR